MKEHIAIWEYQESQIDRLFAEAANIPISSLRENDKQINSVGDMNLAREHIIGVAQERRIGRYPCSSTL